MKKISCLLLVMIIGIAFVACNADNNSKTNPEPNPKASEILENCPENKNGIHDWDTANCEEPAKCKECNMYKDDKLGNHSWSTATCTSPAKCYKCSELKDDKLGNHNWTESSDGIRECLYCGMLYDDYVSTLQNLNQ